jgi:hypothetical protein
MRKHSHAIHNLRQRLHELTGLKRKAVSEIQALKGKSGTGQKRSLIRADYNALVRPKARAVHLASGLLRGVSYVTMEDRCHEEPPVYGVYKVIREAFGEDEELRDEWTLERVQGLLKRPEEAQKEAA